MSAFIEYLLSNPKNWCIQTMSLFLRAKIESKSPKRIERSLMQIEVKYLNFRFFFTIKF